MTKKKDIYEARGCEFQNEEECAEDLEEEGVDVDEAEKEHFKEDEDDAWE